MDLLRSFFPSESTSKLSKGLQWENPDVAKGTLNKQKWNPNTVVPQQRFYDLQVEYEDKKWGAEQQRRYADLAAVMPLGFFQETYLSAQKDSPQALTPREHKFQAQPLLS